MEQWTSDLYSDDALLLAGDVTDNLEKLESALHFLKSSFAEVFFVPGLC